MDETCLFCKIIAGEIPSDVVHDDDMVFAFNDINPVAPVHQLILPRRHVESAAELVEADGAIL
ncbi:MAG TPA: HIT domain-containing protein, partial [Anaerolineae bacterium]|nr:HIT domain-containing protein [Anaerolineae bacterium]